MSTGLSKPRVFLGVSAFYHDSAAAIVREGVILAAAQEERFSRRKNDERFPLHAISNCLAAAGLRLDEIDAVVFHEKPITKFARSLETFLAAGSRGWKGFLDVIPNWLSERLDIRKTIRAELPGLRPDAAVLAAAHHQSHAASAFFPSPFEEAAVLTIDGVGEWSTTTLSRGHGHHLDPLSELRFPHSLGLLYSAFTAHCGFRVNSGEYKLMGLAPYGEPRFAGLIRDQLLDLKEDGSFWLNLDYFDFIGGERMTNTAFDRLFEGSPRDPKETLTQRHMDLARSVQVVAEEVVLRLARHARERTGLPHLCMAGGVALNCVANGRLLRERVFDELWIQPAAGDAGAALGAALAASHGDLARANPGGHRRTAPNQTRDGMQGAMLGPAFTDDEIEAVLKRHGAVYTKLSTADLVRRTAEHLAREGVVGWFQGRMEFGPRALGHRSILADPRSPRMQSVLNLKIKFRESFRPFAPMVKADRVSDFFDLAAASPYMLLVAPVCEALRRPPDASLQGIDRLKSIRSTLPAITHVDYSARVQTVDARDLPLVYSLLDEFEKLTGIPVLVNTSFNVRGEPVVGSPDDAYRCLVNTEMDFLALGNFWLERTAQPHRALPASHEQVPD